MIAPTPTALAAMAAVVCPEDGGESPFGWREDGWDTEGPSRGAVRGLSAPEPRRDPSGRWTAEIASDGRTGPRDVAPGQPEIGYSAPGQPAGQYLADGHGGA